MLKPGPFSHFAFALGAMLIVALGTPALAGTTGAVAGVVSDQYGHPIADVQVSAVSASSSTKATTGGNGFFALNGLPLDTYLLTFTKAGFQTASVPGVTTVQDQVSRVNVTLQAVLKSLGRVTVRSTTSLVQPNVTSDTYVVSQRSLEAINGTPQDLDGFHAFNSLPGVTTDVFGYPIIRGGAENDVGYQLDGVDNTDPVTGQFLNAITLNGARSVQLSTGGYDVATGNTNTGVINEVIKRGAYPGNGQMTLRAGWHAFDHQVSADYGSATADNRFSYYFSFGGQRNATEYGNTTSFYPLLLAAQDFNATNDLVFNGFYHFGKDNRNELQFLTNLSGETFFFGYNVDAKIAPYAPNNGNVQIGTDLLGIGVPLSDFITLFPSGQATARQNIGTVDTQTFNSTIDKLNYKRQFNAQSFGEIRLYRTSENLIFRYPYNLGSFTDFYEDLQTTGLGTAFNYDNQVSSKHEIGFGGEAVYYKNQYRAGFPSLEVSNQPLEAIGCPDVAPTAAGNGFSTAGIGGCYIGPLNAALNANLGTSLPTGGPLAPLQTFNDNLSHSDVPLHRYALYVKDRYQPNDRFTVAFGLRFDKESIPLPADAATQNMSYFIDDSGNLVTVPGASIGPDITSPSQISPRIAASYQLGRSDVVRFSYGKNIEFEPTSAVVNTYVINPAAFACTLQSGCFLPLPGGPTLGGGGTIIPGTTNQITNLGQQILIDLNTNSFAQYTPVRPQHATSFDFSWEHDFGHGIEVRLTPYYRKGTDYVVTSSRLLFTLASGTPVFGPARSENAGINMNTGVEFALSRQAEFGWSGLLDATYDNTLANYDSDFFPTVNAAALAAGHFFHVSYVAPVVGSLTLAYNDRRGFHFSMNAPYESGYRYGVGKKRFIFVQNPSGASVPVEVLNTDLVAPSLSAAYYFTDPANPGTSLAPNIIGSKGTPEGDDPGTLRGPQILTLNATVSHDVGSGPNHFQIGVRVVNIFGNYTNVTPARNLYYVNNGFGAYGPGSGVNTNAGIEPFQFNNGPLPYVTDSHGPPRAYTFFLSMKY